MGDFLAFSINSVEGWLVTGGYFVLFGLLFMCGLGLPLPEDIPLLAAGALIAAGKMHLAIASIAAWCGIIGGDIMLYHLGKRYGLQITKLPFVGKHLTVQRIEKVEVLFTRYGVLVVAIGRLFAGIRGAMVVAAGAIRYNFITFIIADGFAALVSGGIWILLGYWLGNRLKEHMADIDRWKHYIFGGLAIAVVLVVAGMWIWKRLRRSRTSEEVATAHTPAGEPGHNGTASAADPAARSLSSPAPAPAATPSSDAGAVRAESGRK